VGVSGSIRVRMVASVDRNPFPGHRTRAEPQPESKEVPQQRVQHQAAMGLVAVQVQAHPEKRELNHRVREYRIAPPWEANYTVMRQPTLGHRSWTSPTLRGVRERRAPSLATAQDGANPANSIVIGAAPSMVASVLHGQCSADKPLRNEPWDLIRCNLDVREADGDVN
jgi:hypothetical protein